ncbi:molybdopterin-dependent oxidoreductase [Rhizobium sp. NZLR1]|uniref:molybdopterin-dependent oxidoreductase n=1 Tax=Rhizobium sp. NZLR1 TaxID=2731096 RepID=UPI001A98B260|nr:molybdopterin-dependent oxidoreductase [Rhizobium sp. NZLR1]MBX5204117.1 molybdopterin-dependent oxidoreductase [Rhizobium sp. NZLR1]QSZ25092.1 molybdopterin-dependent oxidoreductase [Rhizobium sp. NZLR1]
MEDQRLAFTLGHWGLHEVQSGPQGLATLRPWRSDPDPSEIGLDQLSAEVDRLRVLRPAFRKGWLTGGPGNSGIDRGSDRFVELPWDEAFDIVANELNRVVQLYGNTAIYGGSYGWGSAGRFHHAQSQIHRFLNVLGGYVKSRDSYSYGCGSVIMPHIVGPMESLLEQHTDWETLARHTTLFVAFGGLPLRNTQMSPGGTSQHRVKDAIASMRAMGKKFINVSPLKNDISGAAEWVPIRPGTDVALMLALAFVLLSENLHDEEFLQRYCVGATEVKSYLLGHKDGCPKSPAWAEAITGIPADRVVALARDMAGSVTMVNASWSLQRQSHGEQSYWALVTLASMLGQIGLPGGGFGFGYGTLNSVGSSEAKLSGPRFPQGNNPIKEFIPVARVADMLLTPGGKFTYDGSVYTYPDIKLIYWAGGNPFHHHQDLNRLRRAWQNPETIIVNEPYWTATAKAADIVLPTSTYLERNDLGYASREGHLVAVSKCREPLADSKSDFDIFTGIADRLQLAQEFTLGKSADDWLLDMYEQFRRTLSSEVDLPKYDDFLRIGRVELSGQRKSATLLAKFREDPERNQLSTPSGRIELFSSKVHGFDLHDCPGQATWLEPHEWLGSDMAQQFPLHLLSQEPRRRLHSQLDHSAYSRAGKIKDREPILMNPNDAKARGIDDGDIVRVFNERGACLAALQVVPDLMQKVVILRTGAWFDPVDWGGADVLEKHGNPNVLTLDKPASGLSQATIAQTCLVEVERFAGEVPPVTAFDLPDGIAKA